MAGFVVDGKADAADSMNSIRFTARNPPTPRVIVCREGPIICDVDHQYGSDHLTSSAMNKHILIAVFLLASATLYSQDARAILTKSRQKCQSIQNGYYEMTKTMRAMASNDTTTTSFTCHFRKLADDTIRSSAFHSKMFWKGEHMSDMLYTGDDYVMVNVKDSVATIMAKSLWAKEIKSSAYSDDLYAPLTSEDGWPLPTDSQLIDSTRTFKFIGVETVGNASCYHIQENLTTKYDSTAMANDLRIEFHFWIDRDNYIPIQFSANDDVVMNNDTMYQYEFFRIGKYELDDMKDTNVLSLKSVPAYMKLKTYARSDPNPIADTSAPNWDLYSLSDEKVSLENMRGHLVLVDFFYKSCYPCMLALPAMQALHEKFKDRGLIVVGIDPYDKKKDIASFLSKRGITYTVLLGGRSAAKAYRVTAYPAIFLIDRQGRIIHTDSGYSREMGSELEALIIRNL